MKQAVAVTLVVYALSVAASHLDGSGSSALVFDEAEAKSRPVSKVITLMKGMLQALEKEGEEDEETYDRMACWCETNDKEKTKTIADFEAHIADLTTKIEQFTATSSRLGTEVDNLKQEIAEDHGALDEATSLRQKQLAEFQSEEKDLLGSISALKEAIRVMSKHHSGAMLQLSRSHVLAVAATLQKELQRHASLLQGVLTHSERRAMNSFVQDPEDFLRSGSVALEQQEQPESGEIFGVLTQMKETFESNLADVQKEEQSNLKAYNDLKSAKMAELAAAQEQLDVKVQDLAENNQNLAQAKEDLEDSQSSMSADQQFLAMLKEKCASNDQEWEARQKTRQSEMETVSKALSVLSSDDAHDLFTRTFNPALLQKEASISSDRRREAARMLSSVAQKLNRTRLATLASVVQIAPFTRVKQAIDSMVSQLKREKEDEIRQKDDCNEEIHHYQRKTEKKETLKSSISAKIEDLQLTMSQLGEATKAIKAEVTQMQVEVKRAGEDFARQKKEFQKTLVDQQQTQKLLQAAYKILGQFYMKQQQASSSAALVQKRTHTAGPPAPEGFEAYTNNDAAYPVMSMLQQIIADAKAMEAAVVHDQENAKKELEAFVEDTNASISAASKDIINKSEEKSRAEADLVEAKDELASVSNALEQLANYETDLHARCDFTLKNFEIRQTARDEEIDALAQAKAILGGAKFEALLQGA